MMNEVDENSPSPTTLIALTAKPYIVPGVKSIICVVVVSPFEIKTFISVTAAFSTP